MIHPRNMGGLASAIGVTNGVVNSWIARGLIDLDCPDRPGKGRHRRFSIQECQRISLIAALHAIGFPLIDAAQIVRRVEMRKGEIPTNGALMIRASSVADDCPDAPKICICMSDQQIDSVTLADLLEMEGGKAIAILDLKSVADRLAHASQAGAP